MEEFVFEEVKDALSRIETGHGTVYDARLLRAVLAGACVGMGHAGQAVELIGTEQEGEKLKAVAQFAAGNYGGTA